MEDSVPNEVVELEHSSASRACGTERGEGTEGLVAEGTGSSMGARAGVEAGRDHEHCLVPRAV